MTNECYTQEKIKRTKICSKHNPFLQNGTQTLDLCLYTRGKKPNFWLPRLLWLSVDCQWLSMIVNDCQWLSMIANDCQWLPLIVDDCHWLSLIVCIFLHWKTVRWKFYNSHKVSVLDGHGRDNVFLVSVPVSSCLAIEIL